MIFCSLTIDVTNWHSVYFEHHTDLPIFVFSKPTIPGCFRLCFCLQIELCVVRSNWPEKGLSHPIRTSNWNFIHRCVSLKFVFAKHKFSREHFLSTNSFVINVCNHESLMMWSLDKIQIFLGGEYSCEKHQFSQGFNESFYPENDTGLWLSWQIFFIFPFNFINRKCSFSLNGCNVSLQSVLVSQLFNDAFHSKLVIQSIHSDHRNIRSSALKRTCMNTIDD